MPCKDTNLKVTKKSKRKEGFLLFAFISQQMLQLAFVSFILSSLLVLAIYFWTFNISMFLGRGIILLQHQYWDMEYNNSLRFLIPSYQISLAFRQHIFQLAFVSFSVSCLSLTSWSQYFCISLQTWLIQISFTYSFYSPSACFPSVLFSTESLQIFTKSHSQTSISGQKAQYKAPWLNSQICTTLQK